MRRGALLFLGACALATACAVGGQIIDEDSGTPADGSSNVDVKTTSDGSSNKDGATSDGGTTCQSPDFLCPEAGCVDLASDPNHCGQCNTACASADAGALQPGSDENPDAGVPLDASFDGAPWSTGTPTCSNKACGTTCPGNQTLCTDGICYDTSHFHEHCGDCNTACQSTEYCTTGHCCSVGTAWCGSSCINVLGDPNNCGACGNKCTNGYSCVGGQCTACSNTNIAPLATASSSGGGTTTYGPADMNDGKGESALCTSYEWTTAGNTPGTDWIQYTWSTSHKIASIALDIQSATTTDSCGNLGRTLGAAQVQWWNGSSWVTDGTVSGKLDDWTYTFTSPVTTTQIRLYAIYCTNTQGQQSNPIVYEWQVTGCN